jgi:hypothetical protein
MLASLRSSLAAVGIMASVAEAASCSASRAARPGSSSTRRPSGNRRSQPWEPQISGRFASRRSGGNSSAGLPLTITTRVPPASMIASSTAETSG